MSKFSIHRISKFLGSHFSLQEQERKEIRFVLGIPHRDLVSWHWCEYYTRMIVMYPLPASIIVPVPDSVPIDVARNLIAAIAMRMDAKEAVCMFDSDIIPVYLVDKNGSYKFRYDAFHHLVQRLKESPVVSGVYFRRRKPYLVSSCYNYVGKEIEVLPDEVILNHIDSDEEPKLIPMDRIGLGLSAISMDVIKKLDAVVDHVEEELLGEHWVLPQMFPWKRWRVNGGQSEDFEFCKLLKEKLNITPCVDPSVVAFHLTPDAFVGPVGRDKLGLL